MNSIFISYRRDDGISVAKLLKAIIEKELEENIVFLDTSTIAPGEKWRLSLQEAVRNSKVVISVVGPYWKGKKYYESRLEKDNRLFEEDD